MDLVTSCKEKLVHFRVKDIKDILTELGLSKQGKKQDLVDRILAIISDDRVSGMWAKRNAVKKEEVVKLVDDVHRKLKVPWEADLAPKSQNATNVTGEVEDTYQIEQVRCLCGSTLQADSMIKCEDKKCNVLQHFSCAIIPEMPLEGIQPTRPTTFYCELCRLARADPFWVALGHPLYPVKLAIASVPTDGTNPLQSVEKTFQLTKADWDSLVKPEFEVQAWCMLLNDKVSFRMHWPQYAELQVNGMPVPTTNRPGTQLLGANGRDDGPLITPYTYEGHNKITLAGCDARVFCLGVRIVRRQTVQQILSLIPGESDGERFKDALARVCRCVGGGAATENGQNADSDSDLEVVADCIPVNLRCPMSGSRMKTAGRFKPCAHMGCFDLEVFVQMNQRSRKWQCPICLKNYSLEDVIIDPYFTRITTQMRDCEEDIAEIEVKPDGSWRVKPETDQISLGQLGQWHLPDGTLLVPMEINSKPKPEPLKPEGGSEVHNTSLKLGLKKNKNGIWEVSKHQESNNFPIINQDGGGHFGHSATNVSDFSRLSPNVDPVVGAVADVIVLSDSDDETEIRTSNKIDIVDGFNAQFWSLPSTSQVGSTSINSFITTNEIGFNAPQPGPDSSLYESDLDMNDGLVDNPLAFGQNDPSLQLFLPTLQPVESNGFNVVDDWMLLGGSSGGDSGVSCEPANMNELNLIQQAVPNDGEIDTLADTGAAASSMLLGMNDSKSGKTRSRETSDTPFSFPRQKRSARTRLYLS